MCPHGGGQVARQDEQALTAATCAVSAPHRAGEIGSKVLLMTTKDTGKGLLDYSTLPIKEPIIWGY